MSIQNSGSRAVSSRLRSLILGVPVVVFCLLFLHTAWVKSPTWDETGYLGLGAYLLKTGRWDVRAAGSHPPLAFYVNSIPSLLYPIDWSRFDYDDDIPRDIAFLRTADLGRGNGLLLDPAYDGETFFFWTRATSLTFALWLFFVLYRWSSRLHDKRRALLVLFLAALSPNLLAHAPLINTDFALAVTFFTAVYAFRHLLLHPGRLPLLAAGLSLGAALLCKLSALVLLPILAVLALWFGIFAATEQRRRLAARWPRLTSSPVQLAALLVVLSLSLIVVWIGYGFQVTPYLQAVRSQLWDISTGHSAYLMGSFSTDGWWYYFPLAFLIKTPLPTLALGALGLFAWIRSSRPSRMLELGFIVWPPLLVSALFILSDSKNIGLRYLLPVYPFLFLLAGAARESGHAAPKPVALWSLASWRGGVLAALCLWYVVGAVRIHPHHLAYFNELIGGPRHGRHYLVDSNLDWGQDLKGLKAYMDERGIERVKLSYFGSVHPALYDLDYEWLPSFWLHNPSPSPVEFPTTGIIAISVTNLVGVYMGGYGHGPDLYAWLRDYEPVARLGHSIFVYDIPDY